MAWDDVVDLGDGRVAVWNDEAGAWDYQNSGIAGPEEGMNFGEASAAQMYSAAKQLGGRFTSGAAQLGNMALGESPARLEAQRRADAMVQQEQELMAPLGEARPGAQLLGDIVGSVPVGGKAVGGALGAMEGLGRPEPGIIASALEKLGMGMDSPMARGINAAEMAALGILGDVGGRSAQRQVAASGRRLGASGEVARNRQQAVDTLNRERVDLTPGQRTQDPVLLAQERARGTAGGTPHMQQVQKEQLAEIGSEALGLPPRNQLSPEVLGEAADTIGDKFDLVAELDNLPRVSTERLLEHADRAAQATVDPGIVQRQIDRVADLPERISGQQYLQVRSDMNKITEQLYRKGDYAEAEVIDDLIDSLDEAVMDAAPADLVAELGEARKQWKLLKTFEMGRAIGQTDEINPVSLQSAARRKYGAGLRRGRYPEGRTGEFLETIDAYNRMVKPFQDSGTASRLIPFLGGSNRLDKAMEFAGRYADEATRLPAGLGGAAGRVSADDTD